MLVADGLLYMTLNGEAQPPVRFPDIVEAAIIIKDGDETAYVYVKLKDHSGLWGTEPPCALDQMRSCIFPVKNWARYRMRTMDTTTYGFVRRARRQDS